MRRRALVAILTQSGNAELPAVTRSGDQLLANGTDFRFSGCNAYWFGAEFREAAGWNVNTQIYQPSHFRVDDALTTAQTMGCNVIRPISLGWSVGSPGALLPVLGGAYNEDAFVAMDYAIYKAGQMGIYLIIPLMDNYNYYWGTKDFFGVDFFNNATAINNHRAYVSQILNRVNIYNGKAYKNDPTILAWEAANEVTNDTWCSGLATYVKSIDTRHLFADSRGAGAQINGDALSATDIDIVMIHIYSAPAATLATYLTTPNLSNKVLVLGEYDPLESLATYDVDAFLTAVRAADAVRGDMWWNLASHADTYGWAFDTNYYVGQTVTGDIDIMYGASNHEAKVTLLRNHHYAMRGLSVPSYPAIDAPVLSNSAAFYGQLLTWRGVAGAKSYTLERSTTSGTAGFSELATGLGDGTTTSATGGVTSPGGFYRYINGDAPGATHYFRIKALNGDSTASAYSNVVSFALPSSVIINDAFTDTDGTLLTAHTIAPTNVPAVSWVDISGTTKVLSNRAIWNTKVSSVSRIAADSGEADVLITANIRYVHTAERSIFIIARATDATHYWAFSLFNGSAYIQEIDGGSTNRVTQAMTLTDGTVYPVTILILGTLLQFQVNGYTLTYTSSTHQTNTKHGIGFYCTEVNNGNEGVDDFRVFG